MRELAERAYFLPCQALGWLLRSVKYATVRVVRQDGALQVRKRRSFYAPLLVRMSDPLVKILDAGVRVLPQREWEDRERLIYLSLHGASIRVDAGGTLVLPRLPGETLASLLEDPARKKAIELSVAALAKLHHLGFTHGDAMAENVLVDLEAGVAHWFDFETLHDSSRPIAWRRADDVRALLITCLVRTAPEDSVETLRLILDSYPDEVSPTLAACFRSALRRPLAFYLSQAGLSFRGFRQIGRLLREREETFSHGLYIDDRELDLNN